jgi:hypothetical protein
VEKVALLEKGMGMTRGPALVFGSGVTAIAVAKGSILV